MASAGGGLGGLLRGPRHGGGIWADGEGGVLGGCHGVGALRVCMWSQTARGQSDVVLECAVSEFYLSLFVVAYSYSTEELREWDMAGDALGALGLTRRATQLRV